MSSEAENLTLEILREVRSSVNDIRSDVGGIKDRLDTLETQMSGLGGMLTLIYGKQIEHDGRIEALEAK